MTNHRQDVTYTICSSQNLYENLGNLAKRLTISYGMSPNEIIKHFKFDKPTKHEIAEEFSAQYAPENSKHALTKIKKEIKILITSGIITQIGL